MARDTIPEYGTFYRGGEFHLPRPFLRPFLDDALREAILPLGWPTPGSRASIPPMVRAVEPAPEPESASVQMLRALVADRRRIKQNAESSHKSRIKQAEDAERRAVDLRERAKGDEATAAQADEEIAAILADIEKLGGKPEADA